MDRARNWLQSFSQKNREKNNGSLSKKRSITISIASGKGGVGKTSVAIKTAQILSERGYKVLLLDCDYNLSNSLLKLGLPIEDNFFNLVAGTKTFSECVFTRNNLDILSGCNGNLALFEDSLAFDHVMLDIVSAHEEEYDFILLDSPAGIQKENVNLSAYCDYRFIVVNPDRSSITDSYSLMKILKNKYGISNNHLLVNKVSSQSQYQRIIKTLSETVENFMHGRLAILGGIANEDIPVDQFDRVLMAANNSIHENFDQVVSRFLEEEVGEIVSPQIASALKTIFNTNGHNVQFS